MNTYKKIACVGDSYSSTTWGLSWPDLIASKLNCDFIRASSSGAGNAAYVEKCHDIVKDPDVDLVIVQLTDPARVVLGVKKWEINPIYNCHRQAPPPTDYYDPSHSHCYKDIGTYTMNIHNNQQHLESLLEIKVDGVDRFWLAEVAGARFWDYQTLHNMLAIKALCDQHNKKLIFWSWFVTWDELILPGYEWLQNTLTLVPSYGRYEGESRNLLVTDGHYATAEFTRLVDEWLWPNLKPLL
jgi:hypothetical protein